MKPEGMPRFMGPLGCPLYAMGARAFLERVTNAQRRMERMQERARHYRALAMRSTGSMEAVRVGGTPGRSRVEEGMNAFMDIAQDIEEEARALRELIRQTNGVIARIPSATERELLELRYLDGLRWEDIARRMMYDERQVRRIHVKALENVQREMDRQGLAGGDMPLEPPCPGGVPAVVRPQ